MMNKIAATVLASTIAMAGIGLVYAGNDGYGHYKGKHCQHKFEGKRGEYYLQRMTDKLDLTEDQVTQIRTIKDKYHPQKQQLRNEMMKNRQSLKELMMADSLDEAGVQQLAETMGKLKTEKILLKSKMMSEINQLLTPEQLEKKRSVMQHRGCKHHGYGGHHERGEMHDS